MLSGYRTDNAEVANSARPFCGLVTAAAGVLLSQSRDLLLLAKRATVELEDVIPLEKRPWICPAPNVSGWCVKSGLQRGLY